PRPVEHQCQGFSAVLAALPDADLEVTRATVERIAAIPPPQADAAMLRARFVEPGRRLAGRLGGHATRARAALAAGDAGTVRRLVEASLRPDPAEVSMRSFALSYGFAVCAGEQP
ncbi:hypothetical protein AB0K48_56110, partial [Nonomuraea sp. NPDC055795]